MNIKNALLMYANDEGLQSAITKAEDYIDILESLAEFASEEEQRAISQVLQPVRQAAIILVGTTEKVDDLVLKILEEHTSD